MHGDTDTQHLMPTRPSKSAVIELTPIAGTRSADESEDPAKCSSRLGGIDILRVWSLDILCCVFAMIALAAIVALLATHDGSPLPRWPLSITLNAVVAILSAVFKLNIAVPITSSISQLKWQWFAERRPLSDLVQFTAAGSGSVPGAIMLIAGQRGLHLASFGALILLLTLAIDPFLQQVVRYQPTNYHTTDSTIARATHYGDEGIHVQTYFTSLGVDTQIAIMKRATNSFTPVAADCATGNCTFGDYRTIAMCSGCADISTQLNHTRLNDTYGSTLWTLPSGAYLRDQHEALMVNMSSISALGVSVEHMSLRYLSTADGQFDTAMVSADIIRLDRGNPYNSSIAYADRCWLQPCVRTYTSSVKMSRTSETLISSDLITAPSFKPGSTAPQPPYFYAWNLTLMPCLLNGTYYDLSNFVHQNDTNTNPVPNLLPDNQMAWVPDACTYTYYYPAAVIEYLTGFLTGWAYAAIGSGPYATVSPSYMASLCYDGRCNHTSITSWFENLAESMTVHMRQDGGVSGGPAIGQAWTTETTIKIYWTWLILPTLILFLAGVLLILTMLKSANKTPDRLWKESPLPLLYHGMDIPRDDAVRIVIDRHEMDRLSKEIFVKLSDDGSGYAFRR